MQQLNYAAQAEVGLAFLSDLLVKRGAYDDAACVNNIIRLIQSATHFQIPEGGRVLDDDLAGIRGQGFRLELPYDAITVSFRMPREMHKDISGLPAYATRRMPMAFNQDDGIVMISIYMVDEDVQLTGKSMWSMAPVGIKFDKANWEADQSAPLTHAIHDTLAGKLPRFVGKPFILLPFYLEALSEAHGVDEAVRIAMDENGDIGSIFELIEALSCRNVGHEPIERVDPRVNDRRVRAGKMPIKEVNVLTIEAPARSSVKREHQGGTHASPHEHRRRGHIRRMGNGQNKFIAPVIVNPGVGIPAGKPKQTWYRIVNAKNR